MRINIQKSSSAIATGLACVGVIATAILAAKKAPELTEQIREAKLERGGPLSTGDLVKTAAPVCWPVVAVGAPTISCIVGIQALNRKQQASLVAAYGVAARTLEKYKSQVKEIFGEEGVKQLHTAMAQEKAEELKPSSVGSSCLFYDMISERYFTSTMFDVRNAEYHFNRNFILHGGQITLNELYDFWGLDHIDGGDVAGWDICQIGEWFGYEWIDFDHELTKIISDEGEEMECYIVSCPFPPCYLDISDDSEPVEFEYAKESCPVMRR